MGTMELVLCSNVNAGNVLRCSEGVWLHGQSDAQRAAAELGRSRRQAAGHGACAAGLCMVTDQRASSDSQRVRDPQRAAGLLSY